MIISTLFASILAFLSAKLLSTFPECALILINVRFSFLILIISVIICSSIGFLYFFSLLLVFSFVYPFMAAIAEELSVLIVIFVSLPTNLIAITIAHSSALHWSKIDKSCTHRV